MKKLFYVLIGLASLGFCACNGGSNPTEDVRMIADRYLGTFHQCPPDSIYEICTDSMKVKMEQVLNPKSRRDSFIVNRLKEYMSRSSYVIRNVDVKGDSAIVTYSRISPKQDTLSPAELYLLHTEDGWKIDVMPYQKRMAMPMPKFSIKPVPVRVGGAMKDQPRKEGRVPVRALNVKKAE